MVCSLVVPWPSSDDLAICAVLIMPVENKARLTSALLSPGRRATPRRVTAEHPPSPPITPPRERIYAVRAQALDNGASPSQSPARRGSKTKGTAPSPKAKFGQHVVRQVSGSTARPFGKMSPSSTQRPHPAPKTGFVQPAFGRALPGRGVLTRRSASDDEREDRLLMAAAAARVSQESVVMGLVAEAEPSTTEDTCRTSRSPVSKAADAVGEIEPDVESSSGGARFEVIAPGFGGDHIRSAPPVADTMRSAIPADLATQWAQRSRDSSQRSITPGGETTRSQGDDIAAAIAAARVAASRGTMDHHSAMNGGRSRELKRERELYVDCANLRWRLWAQEAAREDGGAPAVDEALAPRVASFAAQLLWEHDRAVLEAERCNACAAEARGEAERAESALARSEESLRAEAERAQAALE